MESFALKASLRKETGKKSSKTLRGAESVPCVLYGGKGNINLYAAERDFRDLIYTPTVFIVHLDIEGAQHRAMIKETQFHPVTDKLLHVDFYEIPENKPITVELPVKITGSSIGVREGGKLVLDRRKIAVKGLPEDIPAEITVDITELGVGKSIRAAEITAGKYQIVTAKETPVVSVRATRAAAVAAEAATATK
ncbi:MAG: 50S ribosomal protein L25/general stress protein Ctc [Bacteroidales bacterium]|jgi:large subunit ribosomal protein L25|nr:50S ribosomal protein L25/general stress protein Ctc [Bacteroidales bacterium]